MGQKKLLRFSQIKELSNVFEYPKEIAGTWEIIFENENPIVLELACGRGEYAVGLAQQFSGQNFIGVDVKGNRMYLGAKKALELPLPNAKFLRSQIEMLPEYFNPNEVKEIWITFPDPQLRTSRAKKRLTHPRFLRLYQKVLAKNGSIHLKTDSPDLYEFTLKVANMYGLIIHESCDDVYAQSIIDERLKIKTHYENLDIAGSKKIFYLRFNLPDVIEDKDNELQELLKESEQRGG
ncbi:MAG: tRNA (guanosine(46)-N7)-methyltransferase TrmB [Bacteroidota bacterium]